MSTWYNALQLNFLLCSTFLVYFLVGIVRKQASAGAAKIIDPTLQRTNLKI